MFVFYLISLILSEKSKEKYRYCMDLLEEKIPINRKDKETKNTMKKYSTFFDFHPPRYDEKEKITIANRKLLENVATHILQKIELDDKITTKQMTRCISRSVPLFAYVIVTMHEGEFSNEAEKIKNDFLSAKLNKKPVGRFYTLPQINKQDKEYSDFFLFPDDFDDLTKERNDDDLFLSHFSSDAYDDLFQEI